MNERFNFVTYDDQSKEKSEAIKKAVANLEDVVENNLQGDSRAKSILLTKLEECFMWVGKAVRDDQLKRSGAKRGL